MFAYANAGGALHVLFVLIVLAFLVAAAVAAFRGLWIACLCLVVVAIVAGYLLI
jgi:hypothetical protein